MDRFYSVCPMDYRYIPKDSELLEKIKEYGSLGFSTKMKMIISEVVIPRLNSLKMGLVQIADEYGEKQIPRRVDGIHNGTISIKEIFTAYSSRLEKRIQDIEKTPLDFGNMDDVSKNDSLSDLTYFLVSALSVEANIANDIRHQFRSEIEEFSHEEYGRERVGSSTMPHKKNPIEYEQVVSLWKAYLPRVTSAVLSQVTEHQGDSTNENFSYFTFELLCSLGYTTRSLENSLKNLKINN